MASIPKTSNFPNLLTYMWMGTAAVNISLSMDSITVPKCKNSHCKLNV